MGGIFERLLYGVKLNLFSENNPLSPSSQDLGFNLFQLVMKF